MVTMATLAAAPRLSSTGGPRSHRSGAPAGRRTHSSLYGRELSGGCTPYSRRGAARAPVARRPAAPCAAAAAAGPNGRGDYSHDGPLAGDGRGRGGAAQPAATRLAQPPAPAVQHFDFLVIGSGIAGLSYALKVGGRAGGLLCPGPAALSGVCSGRLLLLRSGPYFGPCAKVCVHQGAARLVSRWSSAGAGC